MFRKVNQAEKNGILNQSEKLLYIFTIETFLFDY